MNDMPSVFRESYPTAVRPHVCCECGNDIDPGEKYYLAEGCWNGEWDRYKRCLPCMDLFNRIMRDLPSYLQSEEGPPFCQLLEYAAESDYLCLLE